MRVGLPRQPEPRMDSKGRYSNAICCVPHSWRCWSLSERTSRRQCIIFGAAESSSFADDIVVINCHNESNKVINPFSEQTATCSSCSDEQPEGFVFFKEGDRNRAIITDGHHKNLNCGLSWESGTSVSVKLPNGQDMSVPAYKEYCVHGSAKADSVGETARIDCQGEAIRTKTQ